jgi:hypothetical protein
LWIGGAIWLFNFNEAPLHPQVKGLQEKLEFVDERLLSLDTSVAWLQQVVLAAVLLSLTSGAPFKHPPLIAPFISFGNLCCLAIFCRVQSSAIILVKQMRRLVIIFCKTDRRCI